MKKRVLNEKNKKRNDNRKLILALIYIISSYAVLRTFEEGWFYHLIGSVFLIAGIYGLVCFLYDRKFIFE